eukprot:Hpha_TRINITY_DN30909_c0_g1::TRINITY_DN30909_c0_g1_i1::g.112253::m.112253
MPFSLTGLLRGVVEPFIRGYLTPFIDDTDPSDPSKKLSFFGDLLDVSADFSKLAIKSKRPLVLKRTALLGLNLPVDVVGGSMQSISLSVPFRMTDGSTWEDPIEIGDTHIIARPKNIGITANYLRFTLKETKGKGTKGVVQLAVYDEFGALLADSEGEENKALGMGNAKVGNEYAMKLKRLSMVHCYTLRMSGADTDPREWLVEGALEKEGQWTRLHRRHGDNRFSGPGVHTFGVRHKGQGLRGAAAAAEMERTLRDLDEGELAQIAAAKLSSEEIKAQGDGFGARVITAITKFMKVKVGKLHARLECENDGRTYGFGAVCSGIELKPGKEDRPQGCRKCSGPREVVKGPGSECAECHRKLPNAMKCVKCKDAVCQDCYSLIRVRVLDYQRNPDFARALGLRLEGKAVVGVQGDLKGSC